MTRRLLLGGGGPVGGGGSEGPPPGPGGGAAETPRPYQFPTNSPYNVPNPALIPTPDGTGDCLHPDVWDAGNAGWHGWRFWMGVTPFRATGGGEAIENPLIMVSNNGYHWRTPPGMTNPIDPWPGQATNDLGWYNSDTDLVYDAANDRLVLTYREVFQNQETIHCRTSSDGVTWSAQSTLMAFNNTGFGSVSQAVLQASPSEWRMYFCSGNADNTWLRYYTAPSPTGPWSSTQTRFYLTGAATDAYHGDFIKDGARYYGVFPILVSGASTGGDAPAVSLDGVNWTVGPAFNTVGGPQASYRPTMQIDKLDPTKVNVWYSTLDPARVYYTRVPRSLWDDLIP